MLALGEPCGVYTLPCAQGLRCIPPFGEQSPLQALLQGRGVCKNIKSTFTDNPPPSGKMTGLSASLQLKFLKFCLVKNVFKELTNLNKLNLKAEHVDVYTKQKVNTAHVKL